jgi:CBS domain-containing protein
MTRQPLSVDEETRTDVACELMDDRGVHHMPVVRSGRMVGFVSVHRLRVEDGSVGEFMDRRLLSVGPDQPVAQVIDIMLKWPLSAVPVIDPRTHQLLGIISVVDVLRSARNLFIDEDPVHRGC